MRAYKYEFNSRVWVPGLDKVQGMVIEQRGHAFRGNSYLVTWQELAASGIEIKEQVYTEADLDAADTDHMVVEHKFNHGEVLQWINREGAKLAADHAPSRLDLRTFKDMVAAAPPAKRATMPGGGGASFSILDNIDLDFSARSTKPKNSAAKKRVAPKRSKRRVRR